MHCVGELENVLGYLLTEPRICKTEAVDVRALLPLAAKRQRLRPVSEVDADSLCAVVGNVHAVLCLGSPLWTCNVATVRILSRLSIGAEEGSGMLLAPERFPDKT